MAVIAYNDNEDAERLDGRIVPGWGGGLSRCDVIFWRGRVKGVTLCDGGGGLGVKKYRKKCDIILAYVLCYYALLRRVV